MSSFIFLIEFPRPLNTASLIKKCPIFNSFNDHRIAMCGAILSSRSIDDIQINNVDSIETSFPNFFENLSSLGFTIDLS